MKKYKPLIGIMILSGILVIISVMAFAVIRANAQKQITTDIAEHLEQRGVPVMYVNLISQMPYEIEIALQSASSDKHIAMEDNWFMTLARREATFAYRTGARLSSYKLSLFNAKGERIFSMQRFLYPEELNQQLVMPQQPKVDVSEAQELIQSNLRLGGLSLENINVIPETTDKNNNQVLILRVSAKDLEAANESLPEFLSSLFNILENGNKELGTNLVLCHLQVADSGGKVLLDFVKDIEAGSSQWKSTKGVDSSWAPQPIVPKAARATPAPPSTPAPYPFPTTETLQESGNAPQKSIPYP
jgi:hypothetical protein